MTQRKEINQDDISNIKSNKHISLSQNTQHNPFHLDIKSKLNQKPVPIQTETEGQEVMLNEKHNKQIHGISNRYQFDQSANNLRQIQNTQKVMSLMTDKPFSNKQNDSNIIQEKLPMTNNLNYNRDKDQSNQLFTSINRFLTPLKKKITFVVLLVISSAMAIQSIFEVVIQYKAMNQLWLLLLEITDTVLLEVFFGLFIVLKQTSKLLIVNNVIVFLFFIIHMVIFALKIYSLEGLIINLFYCLSMTSGYCFSIIVINNTVRSQKNVMQNIEEIINFTEIREEPKNKEQS